jgi:hypothetical protein
MYSQHDLSDSNLCVFLAMRVGCHFAVGVLVVGWGCVGIFGAVTMVFGVIFVIWGLCVFSGSSILTVFFVGAWVLSAIYRTKISSSVSITSSSTSSSSSCCGCISCGVCYVVVDVCICCSTVAHLVVPSISSRFFNLRLVLSTELLS